MPGPQGRQPVDHDHSQSGRGGTPIKPGQAAIGPVTGAVTSVSWDRDEVLKSDTTVTVDSAGGADFATIQDALAEVPRRLYANYIVDVDETGDYTSEDVVVPPVQSEDLFSNTEGGNSRLTIKRQGGSGTVTANSWFIVGGRGQGSILLENCGAEGVNPFDDEDAVIAAYGGEGVKLSSCSISGSARASGSAGVMSFQSKIKIETSIDWGTDLVDIGGLTKQGGFIIIEPGATTNGSVTDHAYEAPSGTIQHSRNGPTSTNAFASDPQRNRGVVNHRLPLVDRDGNLVDFVNIQVDNDLAIRDGDENNAFLFPDGLNLGVVKQPLRLDDDTINLNDATVYDDTNDSMTADPETDPESGYFEIKIGGSTKQVAFHDP